MSEVISHDEASKLRRAVREKIESVYQDVASEDYVDDALSEVINMCFLAGVDATLKLVGDIRWHSWGSDYIKLFKKRIHQEVSLNWDHLRK